MRSLAENLTPPYYAAILNEIQGRPEDEDHFAPADEIVTLATRQPGFLGLETAHHKNGERVMVSYWRDIDALEGWKAAGDDKINHRFGVRLADTCGIQVAYVGVDNRLDGLMGQIRFGDFQGKKALDTGIRRLNAFVLTAISSLTRILPWASSEKTKSRLFTR